MFDYFVLRYVSQSIPSKTQQVFLFLRGPSRVDINKENRLVDTDLGSYWFHKKCAWKQKSPDFVLKIEGP